MPQHKKTIPEVLMDKFTVGDGCWEWIAAKDLHGYGVICRHRKMLRAHRVVYEWLVGPIPEGLVIDHLCVNRGCVRPDHLEPVTEYENFERRTTPNAADLRRAQTHCKNGHLFDEANTYRRREGGRKCRACGNAAVRRYLERKRMQGVG